MERKHKFVIGGVSSIIVIYLIVNTILLYTLFIKIDLSQQFLEKQISDVQKDSLTKINELTSTIIDTRRSLSTLDSSLTSEISQLKATASSDFSDIIEDAIKSVVTIRTDVAQGTGFIITNDGYLVTNAHVLSGGHTVTATTFDQTTVNAEFIGFDVELDIALLKIPGTYRALELGNSDQVQIGEKVIAIGNPLGLQFSVSEGIVSAINRPGPNEIEAYIQTDAALNPGNSGGPLISKDAEAIGINNFKIGAGENLGFALESNYIRDSINAIAQENLGESLL